MIDWAQITYSVNITSHVLSQVDVPYVTQSNYTSPSTGDVRRFERTIYKQACPAKNVSSLQFNMKRQSSLGPIFLRGWNLFQVVLELPELLRTSDKTRIERSHQI